MSEEVGDCFLLPTALLITYYLLFEEVGYCSLLTTADLLLPTSYSLLIYLLLPTYHFLPSGRLLLCVQPLRGLPQRGGHAATR